MNEAAAFTLVSDGFLFCREEGARECSAALVAFAALVGEPVDVRACAADAGGTFWEVRVTCMPAVMRIVRDFVHGFVVGRASGIALAYARGA